MQDIPRWLRRIAPSWNAGTYRPKPLASLESRVAATCPPMISRRGQPKDYKFKMPQLFLPSFFGPTFSAQLSSESWAACNPWPPQWAHSLPRGKPSWGIPWTPPLYALFMPKATHYPLSQCTHFRLKLDYLQYINPTGKSKRPLGHLLLCRLSHRALYRLSHQALCRLLDRARCQAFHQAQCVISIQQLYTN